MTEIRKILIYVTAIVLFVITWFQLSLLREVEPQAVELVEDKNQLFFSDTTERDPSSWKIQTLENEPILSQSSIFPLSLFSKYNENAYPFVSAIVNRIDDSDEGILRAVDHLFKYPFIKEILVHNQVKSRPLQSHVRFHLYTSI
jgi:hypothetical protein